MKQVPHEFRSIEAYVEFIMDDERTFFTTEEILELGFYLQTSPEKVKNELVGYGLIFKPRTPERHIRGFRTSSNDRWFGPGSSPTHGGAAFDEVVQAREGGKETIGRIAKECKSHSKGV